MFSIFWGIVNIILVSNKSKSYFFSRFTHFSNSNFLLRSKTSTSKMKQSSQLL